MVDMTAELGSRHLFDNPRFSVDDTLLYLGLIRLILDRCSVVMDVGCGRGVYADEGTATVNPFDFRGSDRTVIGLDVDPAGAQNPFVDDFRLLSPDAPWPAEDESADLVVSDWTLEHIENPKLYISEVRRVLRPGGVFIARTVNRRSVLAAASRTVPNASHVNVLKRVQPQRGAQDVFPAFYRMNTADALDELLGTGFRYSLAYRPGLENYVRGRAPRLARMVAGVERVLPQSRHTVLVVCAQVRA